MKQIIFLNPVFKQMIWGGNRLSTDFGYDIPGDNTGECWGISAHPNGDDSIANDCYAGMTLSQLWDEHPELFGNIEGDRFPLLIKIIDAKDNLSIQVHPYDEYAAKNENGSLGKTECWYIIDCPDDAKLVVGHNAKTHEELSDMIHEGRWDEFIRYVPIKKGDFIQIDPGTVHAITSGCMILETQQNSLEGLIEFWHFLNQKSRNVKPKYEYWTLCIPVGLTLIVNEIFDLTLKFSDIKINCLSDPIIAFVVYMIVVAIFAKIVIMIMQPLFDQNDDSCFYEDYKAIIDDLIEKKKKASE